MRYCEGESAGLCEGWYEGKGYPNPTKGDVISITLTEERAVTIVYNGKAVTNVFRDLPARDMWVVIGLHERRISAVSRSEFII